MLICGIDEAGRGSLIGPLVVAGVAIENHKVSKLVEIGVKDSKSLDVKMRKKIYNRILNLVDSYEILKIYPKSIDKRVFHHELNVLERESMSEIISRFKPTRAYVDSCDVNAYRFGKMLEESTGVDIIASHKAEKKFPVVSAASIVAKIHRDKSIQYLSKKYNFGSGYPVDQKTMEYIYAIRNSHSKMPFFVRKSWQTIRRLRY